MKRIVLFVVVLAFAVVVQAEELWWFVADDAVTEQWDAAIVYATDSQDKTTGIDSWARTDLSFGDGVAFTDLDGYASAGYSFYVELLNSAERIAKSDAVSYTDLLSSQAISSSMQSMPTPYQFSNFSSLVVPEPTSGLLMLIGLAGLALKRKRV